MCVDDLTCDINPCLVANIFLIIGILSINGPVTSTLLSMQWNIAWTHFLKLINSYEFKFLFTSCAFPIGQSFLKRNLIGSSKSNRKLINFLSNEFINLRNGIGAIFYQHFHCIDSKARSSQNDSAECRSIWESNKLLGLIICWPACFELNMNCSL
jgi:hypothetical protein